MGNIGNGTDNFLKFLSLLFIIVEVDISVNVSGGLSRRKSEFVDHSTRSLNHLFHWNLCTKSM